MGTFKISNPVMWCTLIAVVGMFASHSIIIPMIFFGNGVWNTDFRENMEIIVNFVYVFLVLVVTALFLGLYLLVTPLISSNIGKNTHLSISKLQNSTEESDRREEMHSNVDSHVEENKPLSNMIPKITLKNDNVIGSFRLHENSPAKPPMMTECAKSTVKKINATDGRERERTSGMSRGVKKQLAAILDEFWGLLFDYHGILTEEAKRIRATLLLDLASKSTEATSSQQPATPKVYDATLMSIPRPESPYVVLMESPSYYGGFGLLQLPSLAESYYANCGNQLAYTLVQNEFVSSSYGLQVYRHDQFDDVNPCANPNEDDLSEPNVTLTWGGLNIISEKGAPKKSLACREAECLLIQSLRLCMRKLLKLEGSEWLFSQNGGCDEELIDHFALTEILLDRENLLKENWIENNKGDQTISLSKMPCCGEGCILQARLVVSFGVWCVHRILDLLLVENRPELWGKYTYVLNRLQGILNPAFCKPRLSNFSCNCLPLPEAILRNKENPRGAQFTSARTILELIKNVEVSISGRKGQGGTAAANIAFPKGKENLTSVFRRYKRHLSKTS